MKKLAVFIVLVITLSVCVFSAPIYKYENTEYITESVTLTKVEEFHSDHNISYSYIKMDLTDDRVKLELLTSDKGVDVLDTVKNLALQDENTVAALNGDFFSVHSGNKGFSLGIEKKDGQILQSPINPDTMATVAYNGTEVLMSYLDFHVMVVAPNWEYAPVRHINKHTSYYGDILMYTNEFNGGYSPAPGGDVVEVVVEDGIITEFRRNLEPCLIPEDGCVLVVSEGVSMFFANNFSVGDEIKFDWYVTPSLDDFETAFGGGAMLVYEGRDCGKIGDYSHAVAGLNPRSAIGVDKEGTTLYLVAVNGRQEQSRGMRMSHLAELLINLGCYMAVNLDGGGSTNMVASTMWSDGIVTVNSPTENRRVINAIGVVLNNNEQLLDMEYDEEFTENEQENTQENTQDDVVKDPFGIKIKTEKNVAFAGEKIKLELAVFDDNMRPVEYSEQDVEWYCAEADVEDMTFVSMAGGKNIVCAWLGELYAETEIYVVDEISGIETDKTLYLKKGESKKPTVCIFDYYGRYIDVTDMDVLEVTSSDENVVFVQDGNLVAKNDGTAIITLSKDDVFSRISVAVGSQSKPYLYDFENDSVALSVYPSDTVGNFEITDEVAFSGKYSGKLSFDFTDKTEQVEDETDVEELDEAIAEEVEDVSRAVYVSLGKNIELHENCDCVSVRVYAENDFLHKIKLQLVDGDGNIKLVSFDGEILPGEWNEVAFKPEDVKRPVYLSKIYVLYTPGEEKDFGSVYLDDISFEEKIDCVPMPLGENTYRYSRVNANVEYEVKIAALSAAVDNNPISVFANESLKESILRQNGFVVEKNTETRIVEDDYAMYAFLDTSKGGIRNTSSSQWELLVNAVSATEKENVFIVTNFDIFGNDEFENRVVKDYLASLDKDVFVVSSGDGMGYKNINGVKYFTLDSSVENSMSLCRQKRYNTVEFKFGETVSFEFLQC